MEKINPNLIAPCGMNCRLCSMFQREKGRCPGCRIKHATELPRCVIKKCPKLSATSSDFCYECPKYPCRRLLQLDTRYQEKYHMSMLENLEFIQKNGLPYFLIREEEKWTCKICHSLLCVHKDKCLGCKTPYR